ncbi:amidohydrolase family protein [Rothia sp. ZJ932]|uniref:amidohydrolase family protein n=1 Tax=Rothia sp. ZJ932 TaxID=2810516 RepID=UPI0019687D37|nr:amidohydrolase family protein [Rothia sp. ZJ932]
MNAVYLLRDGSVYSPADPFASAMLTNGEKVEWVGSDAGATSIADDSMKQTGLDGLLVTPGFVAGGVRVDSTAHLQELGEQLVAQGYVAATVFAPLNLVPDFSASELALRIFPYAIIEHSEDVSPESLTAAYGVYCDPLQENAGELVNLAIDAGVKVSLATSNTRQVDAALEIIRAVDAHSPLRRLRAGFRLDGVSVVTDEQLAVCEKLNLSLGFNSSLEDSKNSLVRSITAGISTFIGSDPEGTSRRWGWQLVSDAIHRADASHNISARAAFNAMTRGNWRALGFAEPTQGQLVPGGNADFAVWEAPALMVQTADDRVAAWSTDPRARTPMLPELDGIVFPRCHVTVVRGQEVFAL